MFASLVNNIVYSALSKLLSSRFTGHMEKKKYVILYRENANLFYAMGKIIRIKYTLVF